MVDLDTLATLDSLIWLQTGEQEGQRFQFNQSSDSRNQRKCGTAWSTSAPATWRSGW